MLSGYIDIVRGGNAGWYPIHNTTTRSKRSRHSYDPAAGRRVSNTKTRGAGGHGAGRAAPYVPPRASPTRSRARGATRPRARTRGAAAATSHTDRLYTRPQNAYTILGHLTLCINPSRRHVADLLTRGQSVWPVSGALGVIRWPASSRNIRTRPRFSFEMSSAKPSVCTTSEKCSTMKLMHCERRCATW